MAAKSTVLVGGAAVLACLVCLVPSAAVAGVLALSFGAGAGAALLGSGGIALACLVFAGAVAAFALVRRRLARRSTVDPLP